MSIRNSPRVRGSSLNTPIIELVTVLLPGLLTPLMVIHMWLEEEEGRGGEEEEEREKQGRGKRGRRHSIFPSCLLLCSLSGVHDVKTKDGPNDEQRLLISITIYCQKWVNSLKGRLDSIS